MEHTKLHEFQPPKSEWGPGPWNDEPDREDFEHAGFPCFALRNHWGAWCGYVGVPPGHPSHGMPYDGVPVEVHGGLTYAASCNPPICHVPKPGEPEDIWWLGFDCGHAWDVMPGMVAFERRMHIEAELRERTYWDETYRDLAFVKAEIR